MVSNIFIVKTESTEIIGNLISFPSLSQYLSISNGSGRKGLGKLEVPMLFLENKLKEERR